MTFRPTTFERLCDSCSGTGVIQLTPEEEKHEREMSEREQRDREAKLEEQTWQRLLHEAIQKSSRRQPYGATSPADGFIQALVQAENLHIAKRLPNFLADETLAHGPEAVHYNYLRLGVARSIGNKNYPDHFRGLVEPLLALLKNNSVNVGVRGGVALSLATIGDPRVIGAPLRTLLASLLSQLEDATKNSKWGVVEMSTSALVDLLTALTTINAGRDPNLATAFLKLLQPQSLRRFQSHSSELEALLRGLLCLEFHDAQIGRQFIPPLVMLRLELYGSSINDANIRKFLAKVDPKWPLLPEAQALIPKLIEIMSTGSGGRPARATEILADVGDARALRAMLTRLQPDRRSEGDISKIREFTTAAQKILDRRLRTLPEPILQIAADLQDLKADSWSGYGEGYREGVTEWVTVEYPPVDFSELRTMARNELARRAIA